VSLAVTDIGVSYLTDNITVSLAATNIRVSG
jgi:hypothetical protein